jgi:hypothetical protein
MTAIKLDEVYLYKGGEWESLGINFEDYTFQMWNGTHEDGVLICGIDENDEFDRLKVQGGLLSPDNTVEQRITTPSRFSAASKWGYSHAILYGRPRTPHDPHVIVLEIAEDAYEEEDISPYPYAVYVDLAFATHLVFVDNFPDLVRLMQDVLPLIGSPAPEDVQMYDLHKWDRSYGRIAING